MLYNPLFCIDDEKGNCTCLLEVGFLDLHVLLLSTLYLHYNSYREVFCFLVVVTVDAGVFSMFHINILVSHGDRNRKRSIWYSLAFNGHRLFLNLCRMRVQGTVFGRDARVI